MLRHLPLPLKETLGHLAERCEHFDPLLGRLQLVRSGSIVISLRVDIFLRVGVRREDPLPIVTARVEVAGHNGRHLCLP